MAKKKKVVKKKDPWRPTKYTVQLADRICELLSTSDKGMKVISEEIKVGVTTINVWLEKHEYFRVQYARAREKQADFLADQIIELSDKARMEKTQYLSENGVTETTADNYHRTRLQIDARKWKASKLYPKKYGDKAALDVTLNKIGKDLEDESYE